MSRIPLEDLRGKGRLPGRLILIRVDNEHCNHREW